MNKIKADIINPQGAGYGSLWRDNNEYYILAQTSANKYCCIGLNDGNRWRDPAKTIGLATDGLTFVAHEFEMKIEIK